MTSTPKQPRPPVTSDLPDSELRLTESQAARLLGVQPGTLRLWRYRDKQDAQQGRLTGFPKAPPWEREGVRGIRYPLDKLRAWIRALPTTRDGVPQLPDSRRLDHREHYAANPIVATGPARKPAPKSAVTHPAQGVTQHHLV